MRRAVLFFAVLVAFSACKRKTTAQKAHVPDAASDLGADQARVPDVPGGIDSAGGVAGTGGFYGAGGAAGGAVGTVDTTTSDTPIVLDSAVDPTRAVDAIGMDEDLGLGGTDSSISGSIIVADGSSVADITGKGGAISGGDVGGVAGQGGATGSGGSIAGNGGTSGSGGVPGNDPACFAFTVPEFHILRPGDPAVNSIVASLTQADKIKMLSSGDAVEQWNTDHPYRSLGVAGLPNFPMRHGTRGVRNITGEVGTTWAVAMARAASFDLELEYQVGKYQGLDMRAAKADLALAPVLNILRHPRWARAQETYGEDPVLVGELGAAFTRGMQTEGSTAACPGGYAGYDTDNNRGDANPYYDEQTLRETYIRPFEIAVKKGDPACIQTAYNSVNGTHCAEHTHLLNDILRAEWKWSGFVLSQWGAGVAGHGAQSMNAGLDLEMPVPKAFTTLSSDLNSGTLTTARLDSSVARIINARLKMNDFDPAYVNGPKTTGLASKPDNVALAERTELEGAVLLKNDGILPFGANVKTIAIVGPDNDIPIMPENSKPGSVSGLGDRGSSQTTPPHVVSYAQGLRSKGGITVKQSADASAAAGADIVIIPVAMAHEDEGEAYGGGADRRDMSLSGDHPLHWTATKPAAFINSVAAINPNIVVLLNVGSAIILENWLASAKGIVQTFYPGQEGGTAVAKLLFGDVNFSGKLPFTVGRSESSYPPFGNSSGAPFNVDYLHGYRLFEKNDIPVRYWFGYGLSYATYEYRNLKVLCPTVWKAGRLTIQVTVQNTGKVDGTEIVQLYIGFPDIAARRRPVKELKAFTRVALRAGQSKDVTLSVPVAEMAYWDTTNPMSPSGGWTVEGGLYRVYIGPSADPAVLLFADFTVE